MTEPTVIVTYQTHSEDSGQASLAGIYPLVHTASAEAGADEIMPAVHYSWERSSTTYVDTGDGSKVAHHDPPAVNPLPIP